MKVISFADRDFEGDETDPELVIEIKVGTICTVIDCKKYEDGSFVYLFEEYPDNWFDQRNFMPYFS